MGAGQARLALRPGPAAATGAAGPSKRLTFSTEHLWVSYPWMAISAIWVGLTIALHAVGEWTGWELLIPVVPLLVTWVMLNPPWAMPVPRSLLGRDLTYRTLFGRSKTLDLGEVSVAGLSGARLVTQQTRFIVLGHPSGKALTWRQRRRWSWSRTTSPNCSRRHRTGASCVWPSWAGTPTPSSGRCGMSWRERAPP